MTDAELLATVARALAEAPRANNTAPPVSDIDRRISLAKMELLTCATEAGKERAQNKLAVLQREKDVPRVREAYRAAADKAGGRYDDENLC